MFFLRKIGKFLRGNATPFQLMAACLLGGLAGFMPGISQAPGLVLLFTLLLLVLNANLFIAGLTLILGKLLYFLLLPASFMLGRFLIDGPLGGLFTLLINAPVTAWFGFEYYAATGGLALGLAYGLICGILLVRGMSKLRRTMADLEENSAKFKELMEKRWFKITAFIFLGGVKGKQPWKELLEKKVGNPVRPLGVVLVVLSVVLLYLCTLFLDERILTMATQSALERVNGATVDIESVQLDLGENRLTINGLAMADANALDTNVFAAEKLEADISGMSLLSKKVAIDRLEVTNASHGSKRELKGSLVKAGPQPTEKKKGEGKSLEDVFENAKTWKRRLAQIRSWLDKLSPKEEAGEEGEAGETLSERLARQAASQGYANVSADHKITGSPSLVIYELVSNGVTIAQLPDETLDISGSNLSTQPYLLDAAPEITVRSKSDKVFAHLKMGGLSASGGPGQLALHYKGLPVNTIADAASKSINFPMRNGTLDISGEGELNGIELELPLEIIAHDTGVTLPGIGTQQVSQFSFPLQVSGPIDNPRLDIDSRTITQAVSKVAKGKFKELLEKEAAGVLESGDGEGSDTAEKAKTLLKGILNKDEN